MQFRIKFTDYSQSYIKQKNVRNNLLKVSPPEDYLHSIAYVTAA